VKKFIMAIAIVMSMGAMVSATTWVKGYYKSNGSYVDSYERSTPSESYTVKGEYKW
jgi:hypothetical protein